MGHPRSAILNMNLDLDLVIDAVVVAVVSLDARRSSNGHDSDYDSVYVDDQVQVHVQVHFHVYRRNGFYFINVAPRAMAIVRSICASLRIPARSKRSYSWRRCVFSR